MRATEKKMRQRRSLEATEAPLPPERAFVVQFRAPAGGVFFVGRVEHISSGDAVRFGSLEALIAFITNVLGTSTAVP